MLKRSDTFTKGKGTPLPKIDVNKIRPIVKMKKFDRNQPIKPVVVKHQETKQEPIKVTGTSVSQQKTGQVKNDYADLKNK